MKPIKIEVPVEEEETMENEESSIELEVPENEEEMENDEIEIDLQNHTVSQKLIPWPQWEKGNDGIDWHTPTPEEILEIIKPELPKEEEIVKKVLKKIPKPKDGKNWENWKDGAKWEKWDPLKFSDLTPYEKQILTWPQGSNGVGVPRGGTANQILAKSSSRDYDTEWINNSGGSGTVDSIVAWHGIDVDNTDPANPIVDVDETELTHNSLWGLQGGTAGQYNHLTDAQVSNLHAPVTVSDTAEIDLTLTGQQISASIVAGSIDESKLDTSVNASLDLADSALQSSAIGVSVQAYSSVLQNTTASFTTTDESKLDNITVTQAVDLDQMEADINALANGMVYKWNWDASAGTFPWSGSAQTGWFYTVSVGWTVDSVVFNIGDRLIATTDNASTTTFSGNWTQLDATDAVTSVFGRTGNVVATSGDYNAWQITNTPAGWISATDVQAAINELDSEKQATLVSGTNIKTVNSTTLLGSGDLAVATTAQGALADSALQPWDIASGTITARADDINFSGWVDGDVLTVQADGSLALETPASGWATTALDNLSSVAINTSLVSDTDNTDDLGSSLIRWATGFFTNLGATGTRIVKGWFTDIESTNIPTVGGTPILSSITAPQFTTIELWHASDTTLSRVSAGVVAVEGVNLVKAWAATSSGLTMATSRLLGRTTASTGAIEEISIGSGLSLSGGSLSASAVSLVPYYQACTDFSNTGRFNQATSGTGANTFGTFWVRLSTWATANSYADCQWFVVPAVQWVIFNGSPEFSCSLSMRNIPTGTPNTGTVYIGIDLLSYTGTSIDFTGKHIWFKLVVTGVDTYSLYATQWAGGAETASSALTTVTDTPDSLELCFKVNNLTSVDYYYRKNGGSWSSATNLTTNLPTTGDTGRVAQFLAINQNTANNNEVDISCASYKR